MSRQPLRRTTILGVPVVLDGDAVVAAFLRGAWYRPITNELGHREWEPCEAQECRRWEETR